MITAVLIISIIIIGLFLFLKDDFFLICSVYGCGLFLYAIIPITTTMACFGVVVVPALFAKLHKQFADTYSHNDYLISASCTNDSKMPHNFKIIDIFDGKPVYSNGFEYYDYVGIYMGRSNKPLVRDLLFYKRLISNRLPRMYPYSLSKLPAKI
jgi:hypothetical protein